MSSSATAVRQRAVRQLAPDRWVMTPHRQRLLTVLACWGALLSLAVATGWWSRVASAHAALVETREAAQALEQQLGMQQPLEPALSQSNGDGALDLASSARSDDDVSALVRWHELLGEHGLRDWQGRTVSAATPATGELAAGGALWQLEGLASYEQGVALLHALARRFPRLVLLQVHVQQMPATERLQWRLELRWTAPLPVGAQRWPPGEALSAASWTNPFASHRLPQPPPSAAATDTPPNLIEADADHVLPRTPLKDIRLIGVVTQDKERLGLVTGTTDPTSAAPQVGPSSAPPWSQRVRVGQILGVEQSRLVAIEPQALVLQARGPATTAHKRGAREVLRLADVTAGPATREGDRP